MKDTMGKMKEIHFKVKISNVERKTEEKKNDHREGRKQRREEMEFREKDKGWGKGGKFPRKQLYIIRNSTYSTF
jgi:hypothetical protein